MIVFGEELPATSKNNCCCFTKSWWIPNCIHCNKFSPSASSPHPSLLASTETSARQAQNSGSKSVPNQHILLTYRNTSLIRQRTSQPTPPSKQKQRHTEPSVSLNISTLAWNISVLDPWVCKDPSTNQFSILKKCPPPPVPFYNHTTAHFEDSSLGPIILLWTCKVLLRPGSHISNLWPFSKNAAEFSTNALVQTVPSSQNSFQILVCTTTNIYWHARSDEPPQKFEDLLTIRMTWIVFQVFQVFGLSLLVVGNPVCLVLLCLIPARRDKVCPLYRVRNWSDTNTTKTIWDRRE